MFSIFIYIPLQLKWNYVCNTNTIHTTKCMIKFELKEDESGSWKMILLITVRDIFIVPN